jgi:transcription antitermination factor NusG
MMPPTDDSWFILRCAGRSTLLLAKTLAEDGFDSWTPAVTQRIRVPRKNVNREITLPLLPSFIFVRAPHLHDLLHLAGMEEKPRRGSGPGHRDFSVFHFLDGIPMISDASLDPLRRKEREIVPKKDAPRFGKGKRVRVNSGAFEGLFGKVERCKAGYALVIFDDWRRPVNIPTFLLVENKANNAARGLDEAA